jgi:hypothetical protein
MNVSHLVADIHDEEEENGLEGGVPTRNPKGGAGMLMDGSQLPGSGAASLMNGWSKAEVD